MTVDRRDFQTTRGWLLRVLWTWLWGPIVACVVAVVLDGSGWQLPMILLVLVTWTAWRAAPVVTRRRRLGATFAGCPEGWKGWAADVNRHQRWVWEQSGLSRPRPGGGRPFTPRIVDVLATSVGPALLVRLPAGLIVPSDVQAAHERLASALRSPLRIDPQGVEAVQVTAVVRDPLTEVVGPRASVYEPASDGLQAGPAFAVREGRRVSHESVEVGVDEVGNDVAIPLLGSSLLIGGLPGSGKSGLLAAILAGLARLPNTAILGIDLKRVELAAWRPRLSALAVDPVAATELLEWVVAEMERRYAWLETQGRRRVEAEHISAHMPLIVVVIDELAELLAAGDKDGEKRRVTLLRRLVAMCRAAGIVVIDSTQKPSADVVPTSFRDLHRYRVALRTSTREMTATIVGAGIESNAPAHELPELPGLGYLVGEGEVLGRRFRSWWLGDEEITQIVASTTGLRVELTTATTANSGGA